MSSDRPRTGDAPATDRAVDRPAVRRAIGLVAFSVVLACVCVMLGLWQWHRHEARAAAIEVVEANFGADPVPLDAVLTSPAVPVDDDAVWRPVRVTGRYDADAAVLLRNRPVAGRPAYHVLVPFVVDRPDGSEALLVVDRGALSVDRTADDVPPPSGTVDLVVRLRADEPASARDAPDGQVQAISVEQVLEAGGVAGDRPAYAGYGALVSESPAAAERLGPLPEPSTDPGSHLSYALQWWTFAVGALIGFAILARREVTAAGEDDVAADDSDGRRDGSDDARGGRPRRTAPVAPARRRRRAPSAEDVEDALIDAQLR
ncbi:SURF1 family protein [Cellulomonas sp. ATA003]|uniref:SURF1 family cytochrome oxidase biogenesis protein n=1 Tax=Cellulomonas sp. ATA003 TaxID=3073064 RepID=UPI0028732B8B|nr:SURF1 family protein [Cellulomonas sp. ATA003]WNB86814.1 SURF1 family protein [Cellulomonas sp. ATA003]